MKIIALEAENIKRLKAVRIEPDGTMQVIGGNNAQGKSSVLDAVWLALGGREASAANPKPLRDGEDSGYSMLDLGDIVVTRTWSNGKTQLKVQSKDGAVFPKPQTTLDALVGEVGFDPLEFTRQDAKKQRDTLLGLVDLDVDLDELAAERARLFDARTQVGRDGKAIGDVPDVPKGAPTQEVSASELLQQISEARENNHELERNQSEIERMEQRIIDLKAELEGVQDELSDAREFAKSTIYVDTKKLEAKLSGIEESNRQARENAENLRRAEQRDQLRKQYEEYTEQIAALDKKRADALAAAKFPIDGLGFDDNGVTYNGIPLVQIASKESNLVSAAIGMALNPKLKVMMIRDGSLLDSDAMKELRDLAEQKGYQILIERVGDADKGAIIIDDGEVKK